MRLQTRWIARLATGYAALVAASCHGGSASPTDAGAEAGDIGGDASEPAICMQFSQVGDPCPGPSPVRCFPECDSGGCFCRSTAKGGPPVWVCQTDLSCIPDCGPLDDGCAPATTGDDAAAEVGPAEGGVADADGGGDAPTEGDLGDAGDAGAG